MNRAVEWLQRRVSEGGRFIDRLVSSGSRRAGCFEAAFIDGHDPLAFQCCGELLAPDLAREAGRRPLIPLDAQSRKALLGGAVMVRNHGHCRIGNDDLAHTRHGLGLCIVDRANLAADDRADCDGRDLHSRHLDVDTELRRAIDLRGCVEPVRRSSDEAEVRGVLEWSVLRYRQGRRRASEGAIAEASAGRQMLHRPAFGAALCCRNIPRLSGGRHEHELCGRADLPQLGPRGLDRCRAARDLQAVKRMAISFLVRRRLRHLHLR